MILCPLYKYDFIYYFTYSINSNIVYCVCVCVGYYRVNYDNNNWYKLIKYLYSTNNLSIHDHR